MVRILAVIAASLAFVACHHAPSNDAIRQAVIDRLSQPGRGLNLSAMDVTITAIQMAGSEADATVSLTLKDAKDAKPVMTMQYHLRQEGSKWVVTGLTGAGASPHGGDSPHGSAPPDAPGGGAQMPQPGDLPPAGKKQ